MIILPLYNRQLIPDGRLFFSTEEFRQYTGSFAQGDKVVLFQMKEKEKHSSLSEDNYFPIGVSGTLQEISPDGYAT